MKLGEALVKEGLISEEQLRRSLERQVICGGRVGTNIVELGILTEEEFTKFLGRYTKTRVADSSKINSIDEETIASISKEMAEKYKIIPFKKEKNRVHLAMLEPKIKTIDELRFITGMDIVPYVLPEIRFLYALEKYYGIKRDLRYISLVDRFLEDEEEQVSIPSAIPPPPSFMEPASQADFTTQAESAFSLKTEATHIVEMPKPEPAPEIKPQPKPEPEPLKAPEPETVFERGRPTNINSVKEAFCDARDRDMIADLFIKEARKVSGRAALFMVKGETLNGWRASNLPIEGVSFKVDLESPTFLADVLSKRIYYRGPVINVKGNEAIVKLLGGNPQDSIVIPISIRERVIALIYADNGNDNVLSGDINYISTLAAMASISFEMLILRKKVTAL